VVVNVGDADQESLDTSGWALATQSAVAAGGCDTPKGLPDDGIIPASSNGPRAELAFGEGRDGLNAWLAPSSGEFVVVDVPDAGYDSVHLFAMSAEGDADLDVDLGYADPGPVTTSVTVDDWFDDPAPPAKYAAVGGMDRVEATDPSNCGNANAPNLFGIRVEADQTKTLENIILTRQGGSGRLAVLGVVGEAQQLTVARSGAGSGSVAGTGIACGADCDEVFDFGTEENVELTATPEAGSRFTGWEGACSGTGACSVVMDEDRTVTARFEPVHELTVTKEGDGAGTVTSTTPGIDCGADCAESYEPGTTVTLQPAAAPGSQFSGWSGACTGMTFDCVVTMDAAKTVTARFGAVVADPLFPRPPLDTTSPRVTATVPGRIRRSRLRRGLPVTFRCSEACTVAIVLRRGRRLLGSASADGLAARSKTARVRVGRRLRRALRRGGRRLTVTITATDAAGNSATPLIKRLRLRRPRG
jgi:hypothetical protein